MTELQPEGSGQKNIFRTVKERLAQSTSLHSRTQPYKKISNHIVLLFNISAGGLRGVKKTSPLAKLVTMHMEGVAITT
jgi:hypothetical protein